VRAGEAGRIRAGIALERAARHGGKMRPGAAVTATIGGAFAAGAAARLLASQRLEGMAAWAGALLLLATLALAFFGLRAFQQRGRRRRRGR
jgi:hypothetical protein